MRDGCLERVEAGPGEPADESFVNVRESRMGQVVAQVVEVGPGPVGADGLTGGLGIGQGFVPGGDPDSVQDPAVAGVGAEPGGVPLVS
jgi:hypothetical protein